MHIALLIAAFQFPYPLVLFAGWRLVGVTTRCRCFAVSPLRRLLAARLLLLPHRNLRRAQSARGEGSHLDCGPDVHSSVCCSHRARADRTVQTRSLRAKRRGVIGGHGVRSATLRLQRAAEGRNGEALQVGWGARAERPTQRHLRTLAPPAAALLLAATPTVPASLATDAPAAAAPPPAAAPAVECPRNTALSADTAFNSAGSGMASPPADGPKQERHRRSLDAEGRRRIFGRTESQQRADKKCTAHTKCNLTRGCAVRCVCCRGDVTPPGARVLERGPAHFAAPTSAAAGRAPRPHPRAAAPWAGGEAQRAQQLCAGQQPSVCGR